MTNIKALPLKKYNGTLDIDTNTHVEFALTICLKNNEHIIFSKENTLHTVHVCNRLPSPSEHSTLDMDTNIHVEHFIAK